MSNLQYVQSGWECDIYAFTLDNHTGGHRDWILRLFRGEDAAEKAALEARGLRQLHAAGYPVPEMLLVEGDETILGKPFIIMEKLDGQALWGVLASAVPPQDCDLLDQFSRLCAHLHRLDWRPFTDQAARYEADPTAILDDWLAARRQLYADFGVEGFLAVNDWLEAHKNRITVRPAVVHLDFHANNVLLCRDRRMAVIDWTQLAVSDYRTDLSWTLMIMGDHGQPHWRETILDSYARAAEHPVEHLDYFGVIADVKRVASTVISLRVGPEKLGMRPETAEKMRQEGADLHRLYERLRTITGVVVPEVEATLQEIN